MLSSNDSDVDIKIADFGTAKRDSTLKTICGTPQYMAPEVLQGKSLSAEVGKGADMWSLGAIAYVALSASMPFVENAPVPASGGGASKGTKKPKTKKLSLYEAICAGAFVPMSGKRWAGVSEAAKDLVAKLLVVDPALRMTAAQARDHPFLQNTPLPPPLPEAAAAAAASEPDVPAATPAASERSSAPPSKRPKRAASRA